MRDFEAKAFSDFLLKILKWEPKDRPTAAELLDHYWLKMVANYNTKMSRPELKEYKKVLKQPVSISKKSSNVDEVISQGRISGNQCPPLKAPSKKEFKEDTKIDNKDDEKSEEEFKGK